MGVGLLEPVDDLGDQSQASHPELLRFLTDTLIELKFDLQAYQAILARTQTYRRATLLQPHSPEETFLFQGRPLTRMRAEQWWDSVMTLIVPDLDERLGAVRVDRNYEMAQQLAGKPLQEMLEVIASESKLDQQIKELQTRVNQLQRKVNGRNRQKKVASLRFEVDRKNLASHRKALAELRKQSVRGSGASSIRSPLARTACTVGASLKWPLLLPKDTCASLVNQTVKRSMLLQWTPPCLRR